LKVLVKHVLGLVILIPLSVLALSAWIAGGDTAVKLVTLFPFLLVSLLFVKPLSRPSVLRFRSLANLMGGILPLASLFLPYSFLGGDPWYAIGPWASSLWVPRLIVLGCLLTFFSRFGAVVTVAGISVWHTPMFFCSANGCPPYTVGPGYWLAWAGSTVSLFGRSWIALPKSVEGRRFLGSIMFPVGVMLAIFGVLLPYPWYDNYGPVFLFPVFMVPGFLLGGAGLSLFLRPESTSMDRIRKVLQKPLL
jgi:hypothetical protein